MEEPRYLVNSEEAAQVLHVTPERVMELISAGELEALSFGRRLGHRIRVSDLETFVAARSKGLYKIA